MIRNQAAAPDGAAAGPPVALDSFARDGYLIWLGFFSERDCDDLTARGRQLAGEAEQGFRPVLQPHRADPAFLAAMKTPKLVELVARLVGGTPKGLQTSFISMPTGTVGYARHQDNFFVEAPDDAFVSAWLALADANRDNGCLFVYPGSHRGGRLPIETLEAAPAPGQDLNARREQTIVPPAWRPDDIAVPKGTIVLLHSCAVHGSHDNRSATPRPALVLTYIREGAPFRPGNSAKREEVDLGVGPRA